MAILTSRLVGLPLLSTEKDFVINNRWILYSPQTSSNVAAAFSLVSIYRLAHLAQRCWGRWWGPSVGRLILQGFSGAKIFYHLNHRPSRCLRFQKANINEWLEDESSVQRRKSHHVPLKVAQAIWFSLRRSPNCLLVRTLCPNEYHHHLVQYRVLPLARYPEE